MDVKAQKCRTISSYSQFRSDMCFTFARALAIPRDMRLFQRFSVADWISALRAETCLRNGRASFVRAPRKRGDCGIDSCGFGIPAKGASEFTTQILFERKLILPRETCCYHDMMGALQLFLITINEVNVLLGRQVYVNLTATL